MRAAGHLAANVGQLAARRDPGGTGAAVGRTQKGGAVMIYLVLLVVFVVAFMWPAISGEDDE
jgi:hypothetical protein